MVVWDYAARLFDCGALICWNIKFEREAEID